MPNNPNFGQGPDDPPQLPPSLGTRSRLLTHPRSTIAEGIMLGAAYTAGFVCVIWLAVQFLKAWAAT